MARFLRQYNLSLFTPHSQRRPTIDPEEQITRME
jgi:hypothetical protein